MFHQLGVINLLFLKYDYVFIFFLKGWSWGRLPPSCVLLELFLPLSLETYVAFALENLFVVWFSLRGYGR